MRRLAPAGIELAPPRREVSTGPGRHDFEIVVDPAATVEEDLRRRDFTVNAMARRLADGTLVDPLRRPAPTSSGRSCGPFRRPASPRTRCGSCADCGSSRSSTCDPDEQTLRADARRGGDVALVSGERIGGGLAADGHGRAVEAAARRAAGEGAAARPGHRRARPRSCPSSGRRSGSSRRAAWHSLTVDEHTFEVVQAAADAGFPLRVRLAALFHDLGKPHVAWRGTDGRLHYYARRGYSDHSHEQVSARLAEQALDATSLPDRRCERVSRGSCAVT